MGPLFYPSKKPLIDLTRTEWTADAIIDLIRGQMAHAASTGQVTYLNFGEPEGMAS